jgi:RNA polymerase sigma-70 factor (ECF subfamily)
LTIIARRVVVHEIARRRNAEALGHVEAHQVSLEHAHVTREHQRVDDREEIELMLNGLPHAEAEVVRQFHIEGRSYREISAGMGIPENTIGPTLTRAREKIRSRKVPG